MKTNFKSHTKTVEQQVAHGASYLIFFKSSSQVVSWVFTFLVARVLSPADYGLMTMATTLTAYAALFSNMGLGSAIIQRKNCTQRELSSVFWFSVSLGIGIGIIAFFLAIPTGLLFGEKRVIPLTRAVSLLFIIEGIQIVPLSLLMRNMHFKKTGLTESLGVIISSIAIFLMALSGLGVWALLLGYILKSLFNLILYFWFSKWVPGASFNFKEVRGYLSFGLKVMISGGLAYSVSFVERFFLGRMWPVTQFGQFGFAKELSYIPTQRVVMLINQVSFSGFSKIREDLPRFKAMYLKILKVIAVIVFPVFLGGFILGDELVHTLLNEKWYPMIPIFKALCLFQIIIGINAINNGVHNALGRPQVVVVYNIVVLILLCCGFLFLLTPRFSSVLVPYFLAYGVANIIWICYTSFTIHLSFLEYCLNIVSPLVGALIMFCAVWLSGFLLSGILPLSSPKAMLLIRIFTGVVVYSGYFYLFMRNEFDMLFRLVRKKEVNTVNEQ